MSGLQVIGLTEELLETAKQHEVSQLDIGTNVDSSPEPYHSRGATQNKREPRDISNHHDKFPVGTKVQAVWSEDGEWYDATIEAHIPNGYYVCFDGWGNKEEVISPQEVDQNNKS